VVTESSPSEGVEADGTAACRPGRVAWLFLDLNSYFASVEQELRAELRGRPIAVVPTVAETTCCIAASYEAKAFGVRTGTQVREARRMCPGIEMVEARHEVYVEYHNKIVEAVDSCVPVSVVMSIDEMACRLIGREQPIDAAKALAVKIKQTIRERAGSTLRCSVGLAPNRYLAKVASDMEKPDGLVALAPEDLPGALLGLTPRDLPGVGARMERRLAEQGLTTMAQILALDRERMRKAWGSIGGEKLWYWLRGEDLEDAAQEHAKSVGHSHVLAPEFRTVDGAWAVTHKLLHKAAMRLRAARLWTSSLTLTIKFTVPRELAEKQHFSGIPQQSWHASRRMIECQDSQTLLETLRSLWEQRPQGKIYERPFFVGVSLQEIVPEQLHTLSLFSDESRRTRLAQTMDALNGKYGTQTLYFAGMHLAKAAAPTRIAFTSVPDLFD
jgi:DNA polymerase-4